MKAWLASDLSELDLLVIQIDGLHVGDHVLMAAIGVDGNGDKHVLAVVDAFLTLACKCWGRRSMMLRPLWTWQRWMAAATPKVFRIAPSGLGPGRRKQGRAALAQPGPASGA